jgi:hypothetical protein
MRALLFPMLTWGRLDAGANLAMRFAMDRRTPATLRAEARIFAFAGAILLAIGLVCSVILVMRALSDVHIPPAFPLLIAGPPLVLGYLACHFATLRMLRARAMEKAPRRRSRQVRTSTAA